VVMCDIKLPSYHSRSLCAPSVASSNSTSCSVGRYNVVRASAIGKVTISSEEQADILCKAASAAGIAKQREDR